MSGPRTEALAAIQGGDPSQAESLLPVVYEELRRLAASRIAQERPGQTLQATALVHEAWLRLLGSGRSEWDGRGHFFAAAAEAMRRILIENARRKGRLKHGGGQERVSFDELELACGMPSEDLLALNDALTELESMDPTGAEIVKLRFFAGLNHPQIATELGLSLSAVERNWSFCKTWLYQRIQIPT